MNLIFKNRNFTLLWFSQLISQLGNRMFQIALLWWIIGQSPEDSGKYAGALLVLSVLPPILFLNIIGRTIDRQSPLRILLPADMAATISAVLLALLYFSGVEMLWIFFGSVFVFGTIQAFIDPTLMKMVPNVVPQEQTTEAVAYLSSTQMLAFFSGAVVGAVLIEHAGIGGVVLLNGLTYFISYFCDRAINFLGDPTPGSEQPKEESREKAWSVLQGLPMIRNLLIGFGIVNMFGTPTLVILPLYTKKVLEQSASMLGLYEGCIWMGIFAGSMIASKLVVERTLTFVAANVFTFGLMIALPGIVVHPWIYGFFLFGMGTAMGLLNVKIVSYFQAQIDNSKKGRFFSLLRAVTMAAMPIGFTVFGFLADQINITTLCLVQGLGVMITSILFFTIARGGEAKDRVHSSMGGIA